MKTTWVVACALCACLASAALAGELPEKFVKAYRPAAERGVLTYSHFTLQGEYSKQKYGEQSPRRYQLTYRRDGELLRMDLTDIGGERDGAESITIANPERSFSASRKHSSDPFKCYYHSAANSAVGYDNFQGSMWSMMSLLTGMGPYEARINGTALDFLQDRETKVLSYEEFERDGRPLVQVVAQVTVGGRTPDIRVVKDITLVLSPSENWALREYSLEDFKWAATQKEDDGSPSTGIGFHWSFDYAGDRFGVPILKELNYWVDESQNGGTKDDNHQTLRVTSIDFSTPAARDFTAADFNVRFDDSPVQLPVGHSSDGASKDD